MTKNINFGKFEHENSSEPPGQYYLLLIKCQIVTLCALNKI